MDYSVLLDIIFIFQYCFGDLVSINAVSIFPLGSEASFDQDSSKEACLWL